MKIPKIIMQTWKTTKLPSVWQESQDAIQDIMPDWRYVLMTDEDNRNFVIKYFPEFLDTYDNFEYPIQRADMIRPMWLYIKGGIYIDLDYVIKKRLDDLFENDKELYLVSSSNLSIYITNSFMASVPNHPFWLKYLDSMKSSPPFWALSKHFHVMTTTGPISLTNSLEDTEYYLLPQKELIPCNICEIGSCNYPGYIKTIEGQSWNGWDSLTMNYVYCKWRLILFILLIIILVSLSIKKNIS